MHVIVADEMQELQVAEPVILVVTVLMVDFCLLLHGEEQSAVPTSSALMLEEFSSDCVQSDVCSFSCAPVAPVAIIRAYAFAQSSMSFDWGLYVPSQRTLFPDDIVLAPASWLEVFLYYPLGAFIRVPPFCPAKYLPPEQMIEPVERFCTVYFVKVMSPAGHLWVKRKDYLIHGSSLSLSEYFG